MQLTPEAIVTLCIIAVFVVFGFLKGVALQIAGVIGLGLAILFAPGLGQIIFELLRQYMPSGQYLEAPAKTLCIFLTGTGMYAVCMAIGYRFHRAYIRKKPVMQWVDRAGGAIGGFLKGALVVFLIARFLKMI